MLVWSARFRFQPYVFINIYLFKYFRIIFKHVCIRRGEHNEKRLKYIYIFRSLCKSVYLSGMHYAYTHRDACAFVCWCHIYLQMRFTFVCPLLPILWKRQIYMIKRWDDLPRARTWWQKHFCIWNIIIEELNTHIRVYMYIIYVYTRI